MTRILKKKFATTSVATAIATVLLANLNVTTAIDKSQMAILYASPVPLPSEIPMSQMLPLNGSYWPDLADANFDNMAQSTCVTGIQLFYDKPNFNTGQPGRVEYIYGPNWKCENLQHLGGKVSSTRFAGLSDDFTANSLTMYQWDYFQGIQELTQTDRPLVTLEGHVKSLIITGPSAWTLYSMANYEGEVACVRSEFPSPAFIYDVTKVGLPPNFRIRSVRLGCFTSEQELQITVDDQSFPNQHEDSEADDLEIPPSPIIPQITNLKQPIQSQNLQKQNRGTITTIPNQNLKPEQIQSLIKDEMLKQMQSLIQVLVPHHNPLLQLPVQAKNQNVQESTTSSPSTLITSQIQNELQRQLRAAGPGPGRSQNTSPSPNPTVNQNSNGQNSLSESQIQNLIQKEIQKQAQAKQLLSPKITISTSTPSPSPVVSPMPMPVVIHVVTEQTTPTPTPIPINPIPIDKLIQNEMQNQIQAKIQSQIQKQMEALIVAESSQVQNQISRPLQTLEIHNQMRNLIQKEVQNEVLRLIQSPTQFQNGYYHNNQAHIYLSRRSGNPFFPQNHFKERNFNNNNFHSVARHPNFRNFGHAVDAGRSYGYI